MTRVMRLERRPFTFIFRLNIVLHDSYQADEVFKEWKSQNGNKKFQMAMSKALAKFY